MVWSLLTRPKLVVTIAACLGAASIAPTPILALPSESIVAVEPSGLRAAHLETIMEALARPAARIHLRAMGISQTQLRSQLSQLDDTQLARVADQAQTIKAAGNGLDIVIALLVIGILLVILLYLLNKDIEIKDKKKDSG